MLETVVKSVNAEEVLAHTEVNKVVTSKSVEEVHTENENESVDPVTINDLMA